MLTLCLLALFTRTAHAVISEPDNRVWGQIVLGTSIVTAAQTNIVVEARRSLSSPPIASYRMGEAKAYGDFYSLAIALESVNPISDPNATRTGEQIIVLVHNGQFVRYLTLYTVGPRGRLVRLDLGDIDSDNNGLVDNWERQFFLTAGQDPNGDPDRDGVSNRNEMLGATNPLVPDARHPADTNPTNNIITIGEVTAYALAWKTGKAWPVAPTNIPVEFVARAGFLWKNGERYIMDTNNLAAGAPLWWTNVPPASGPSAGLLGASGSGRVATKSTIPQKSQPLAEAQISGGAIIRSIGEPSKANKDALDGVRNLSSDGAGLTVTLKVTPSGPVSAYVVEEILPEGWTANEISGEGVFDAGSRRVRWGVFFDHEERTLRYQLRPSSSGLPFDRLSGLGSFDGRNVETVGLDTLPGSMRPQLHAPVLAGDGRLTLRLEGEAGRRYEIQVSEDLIHWKTQATVAAGEDGQLEFSDSVTPADRQRFYRARQAED